MLTELPSGQKYPGLFRASDGCVANAEWEEILVLLALGVFYVEGELPTALKDGSPRCATSQAQRATHRRFLHLQGGFMAAPPSLNPIEEAGLDPTGHFWSLIQGF